MKPAAQMRLGATLLMIPQQIGLVDANDDFLEPTPAQDAQIAAAVNNAVLTAGIVEPDKVKQIIAAVPLFLGLLK
jgi:hypothetical protein